MGKNWEDIPVVEATIEDINDEAIKIFKEKAIKSKRLRKEDLDIDNETLLSNLNLYDGKYLTRAAILLFAKNPEKWLVGSYIKIGFFERNDADLRYQDEVHGSIIIQVDKVMELMYIKYQKALITIDEFYCNSSYNYWLASPIYSSASINIVGYVGSGVVGGGSTTGFLGIRPVVCLKSNIPATLSGTTFTIGI